MENCLVTKLRGVVNDDNLRKLGVLTIKYSGYSSFNSVNNFAIQTVGDGVTVKAVNSYFVDNNGVNIGDTLTISQSGSDAYVLPAPDGSGTIEIHNKYNLKVLKVTNSIFSDVKMQDIDYLVNIDTMRVKMAGSLEYVANLPKLNIFDPKTFNVLSGSIANFAGKQYLTYLNLSNQRDVDGNIASIGDCIALTSVSVGGSLVFGTLESFVQAQRAARVAAGLPAANSTGITMNYLNTSNVTFNGELIPDSFATGCVLTWDASTITLTSGGNTIVVNA